MERSSQPSTNGLSSMESICRVLNNLKEKERERKKTDDYESNVHTKVFTKEEEISLLKQIREDKQSLCICKSCAMDRMKILAYQEACKEKKLYPKSWNKNRQVEQKWLEKFEERHKDEISKFSSTCKKEMSQASTSRQGQFQQILITEDERLLLIQQQKMETRHECTCKTCLMEEARLQALKLACNLKRESWNTEGKADCERLISFTEDYRDEISIFQSICSLTVFTIDEERLLLKELQVMKIQRDCSCKKCLMKQVPILAYKLACVIRRDYPDSWNTEGKADYAWLEGFNKKHKEEISKFPSICSLTVLTIDQERSLLSQLQDMEVQRDCRCKNCLMEEGRIRAYRLACVLHIDCPESWNTEGKADYVWLDGFTERHKDEISRFPSICSLTVLTIDQERSLLSQLQDMEYQRDCRCKTCLMEEGRIRAYGFACVLHIDCPESWNREGMADYGWLEGFTERHRDEISKFRSICKKDLSQTSTSRRSQSQRILKPKDERLLLLQLQEMETRHGCKCKSCLLEVLPILAYKLACKKLKRDPQLWNKKGKAGPKWLNNFTQRHIHEISKFPTVCIRPVLTNRLILTNRPVLTNNDKQLLLTHLQEVKVRGGCKCKRCFAEDVPFLAKKIVYDLNKNYPEWKGEEDGMYKWLRRFEERHNIEISEFPTVCNRSVLTNDDEQLLLTHLQEVKVRGDCKCKLCFAKDVPLLTKKIVYDLNKNYPEWKGDENAMYKWLRRFEERHNIEIAEFPTVCKKELSQVSTSRPREYYPILLPKDERLLLLQLQEMETRHGCKCQNCLLKELPILAYKLACNLKRYPQSWNKKDKAESSWLNNFTQRHIDEISKFPTVCNNPVLTNDDEQLLLTHLQEVKARDGCKCKHCFAKDVPPLASKIFCGLNENYPNLKGEENAMYKWLRRFEERHNIEIAEFPTVCKKELSPVLTSRRRKDYPILRSQFQRILQPKDERLLLIQLQEMETRHGCKCKNCLLKELPILAYKFACNLKRNPQLWNAEGKASSKWLYRFKERHQDEISKFPSICSLTTVLTIDQERSLLSQLQDMEVQRDCKCKNCLMEEGRIRAYRLACVLHIDCPESWNTEGKADYVWLDGFTKRHKDEISRFPSICKKDLSRTSTSRRSQFQRILRHKDERLLLLQLQEIETRHGCKCKSCLLEELPILAHKFACKKLKRVPQSWNRKGKAGPKWLRMFKERHYNEILKFPTVCNRPVLTNDDEQLLLTHLQEVKARGGCICKHCFAKDVPPLAYKIDCDLNKNYPNWKEENAMYKWLRLFEKRHNIEISEFPTICKKKLSQVSTSKRREYSPILLPKDKRLLLLQLQEMETRHGCKCKDCLLKELPILAYKFACNLKRNSKAWDAEGKAEPTWVRKFKKVYKDEISKFSTVCNRSGLTNRSVLSNRPVFTNYEEQLLLTHLQEAKVRGGCKCKRCFAKDVPLLAKKIVYDLNKNYPEWKGEEDGMYKWLRRFEEKHKIEISEFPTVCKAD